MQDSEVKGRRWPYPHSVGWSNTSAGKVGLCFALVSTICGPDWHSFVYLRPADPAVASVLWKPARKLKGMLLCLQCIQLHSVEVWQTWLSISPDTVSVWLRWCVSAGIFAFNWFIIVVYVVSMQLDCAVCSYGFAWHACILIFCTLLIVQSILELAQHLSMLQNWCKQNSFGYWYTHQLLLLCMQVNGTGLAFVFSIRHLCRLCISTSSLPSAISAK